MDFNFAFSLYSMDWSDRPINMTGYLEFRTQIVGWEQVLQDDGSYDLHK